MELLKKKTKRKKTIKQDMVEKSPEGKSKEAQIKEDISAEGEGELKEAKIKDAQKNIISVKGEEAPKEAQAKEAEKNIISVEGYRKNKILDLMSVPEFNTSETLQPPSSDLSLFEIKKLAELYLKENKYNIEEILEYDDIRLQIWERTSWRKHVGKTWRKMKKP